ncbi:hypothetical protein ABPG72_005072 [Tetrahymena utriculariae]
MMMQNFFLNRFSNSNESGATIFLHSQRSLQNQTQVNFADFIICANKAYFNHLNVPCADTEEYQQTYKTFIEKTSSNASQSGNQYCTDFVRYSHSAQPKEQINNHGYCQLCYISEQMRQLANTNECFFKNQYAPIYLICGDFNEYAYPPYTSFDINS